MFYLSEAIIARKLKDVIETITNIIYVDIENITYDPPLSEFIPMSMSYTVPSNLANNTLLVTLSGAKGSDSDTDSGSYGEIVTSEVTVTPGETIPIYIGTEGTDGDNGESSSFGTYLVANGGLSADNKLLAGEDEENYNTGGAGFALIRYALNEEEESNE